MAAGVIGELRSAVEEAVELTGAARPAIQEQDSPVLREAVVEGGEEGFYLIGLIGGKNVGKSSLVNALVGREITARTSTGPGTEKVIAYAHESQVEGLRKLLEAETPGLYEIVPHRMEELRRQVLLDLPDIDSHYQMHVEVTRRMLRHMLYPIWISSIEKYADARPRELLEKVAAGNAPQNFLFCLNKADYVVEREPEAAEEIRQDYAGRIARAFDISPPPRVWLISAAHPERYDLPALRRVVCTQKNAAAVRQSRQLAQRRQAATLMGWLERQGLREHLGRLQRLERQADEQVQGRVGAVLLEQAVPGLLKDRAHRLALADDLMRRRVERWPIVNVFNVLLEPLMWLLRRRLTVAQQAGVDRPETIVDQHMEGLGLPARIQTAFAHLQQAHPAIGRLYGPRRLWEPEVAAGEAADLRDRLRGVIEGQDELLRRRFDRGGGPVGALFRTLLTVGAVLWFPLVQPLLQAYLSGDGLTIDEGALLVVELLGTTYLLRNAVFLGIYFVVLWLVLRWGTQRRVERWMERWVRSDTGSAELSLTQQTIGWLDELVRPVRAARERMESLVGRVEGLREAVQQAA